MVATSTIASRSKPLPHKGRNAVKARLQKEWGDDYDRRLRRARHLIYDLFDFGVAGQVLGITMPSGHMLGDDYEFLCNVDAIASGMDRYRFY